MQSVSIGMQPVGMQPISKCNPSAAQIQTQLKLLIPLPLSPMEYDSNREN